MTITNYVTTGSKNEMQRLVGKFYLEGKKDIRYEVKKDLEGNDLYYVYYSFVEED